MIHDSPVFSGFEIRQISVVERTDTTQSNYKSSLKQMNQMLFSILAALLLFAGCNARQTSGEMPVELSISSKVYTDRIKQFCRFFVRQVRTARNKSRFADRQCD
jgi:uncharacterized lipoprotein YajG